MPKPIPSRKQNYAPVPLYRTHPLPLWQPTNPLCMLSILLTLLLQHTISPPQPAQTTDPSKAKTRLIGYLDRATHSVHVTDERAARELWEGGFYGKGSLSRSVPEWKERERRKVVAERSRKLAQSRGENQGVDRSERGENGTTREKGRAAQEVTNERRQARRKEKLDRARKEIEELERRKMIESAEEGRGERMANGHVHLDGSQESDKKGERVATAGVDAVTATGGCSEEPPSASLAESDAAKASLKDTSSSRPEEIPQQRPHTETNAATDLDAFPEDQEHLQLDPCESFFLSYALGVISITDPITDTTLSNSDLLQHFCDMASTSTPNLTLTSSPSLPLDPANPFLILYVAYHHFRSLGWCARPGVKFSVDLLLYARGPPFAHAEFAVLVVPSFDSWSDADKDHLNRQKSRTTAGGLGLAHHSAAGDDWHWLHCVNRVQNQVRKTLVLCFVDVPVPGDCEGWRDAEGVVRIGEVLSAYKVREFVVRRWSPNRNRD